MARIRILVNADDFGYSDPVNRAILSSIRANLVTSTSLMVNMPGFAGAIAMTNLHPSILEGRVGLHLNLTEGYPLTTALHPFPVFCDPFTGLFIYNRKPPLFRIGRQLKQALYKELKAQVETALEAGIKPAHIDSHHHIHTEWAMAPIVCRLAKEYGISRIRLNRNMGRRPRYLRRVYQKLYNSWQLGRQSDFRNTDYFGDIDDFRSSSIAGSSAGKSIEIMVHPLYNEQGVLVDLDQQDLRLRLRPFNNPSLIQWVSPGEL